MSAAILVRRCTVVLALLLAALVVPGPVAEPGLGGAGLGGAVLGAAFAAEPGLSVSGNQLLKDGEPYLPRGFNMIGLLTPDWCTRANTEGARANFGQAEMDAAKAWHATTLRFQVSERGLADPSVTQADRDAYLQKVRDGVALARLNGFTVILSMQDQYYGCGDVHPLPSARTVAAWDALAPAFTGDPYVMFELFNEPRNADDAAGWAQWLTGGSSPDTNLGDPAVGHQALVDHLRALGSGNVLLADAARLAKRTTGMPLLQDPTGNVMYAVHPYNFQAGLDAWESQYGAVAAVVPLLATEWNYLADGCGTSKERLAPDFLSYTRDHDIGVLGHAFDAPGTLIADWAWTPTQCGTAHRGSGQVLRTFFGSLTDAEAPPTPPAGLHATDVQARRVSLAWTASTDDVGVAGYRVVRDGAVVADSPTPAWSDTTVTPETTYVYTVRAYDAAGGTSGDADLLTVTTPDASVDTTPPSVPGSFTARVAAPGRVVLSWQPSSDDVGVTGYTLTRDGAPLTTLTGSPFTDTGVAAGPHTYGVAAFDGAGNTSSAASATATVPSAAPSGLTGTYFDTATLTTQKLVRVDPTVTFSWGTGAPAPGVGADTFSVRWTGRVIVPAGGTWTFITQSDDGVRLWVDGRKIVDNWTAHRLAENRAAITLSVDRAHDIRIEYYDKSGAATMRLLWSGPGTAQQVIPATALLAR